MRNVIDTLAIGMGGIFLQCHVVARFCNAMSSLFADAMIGQSLIFRRGDRPEALCYAGRGFACAGQLRPQQHGWKSGL